MAMPATQKLKRSLTKMWGRTKDKALANAPDLSADEVLHDALSWIDEIEPDLPDFSKMAPNLVPVYMGAIHMFALHKSLSGFGVRLDEGARIIFTAFNEETNRTLLRWRGIYCWVLFSSPFRRLLHFYERQTDKSDEGLFHFSVLESGKNDLKMSILHCPLCPLFRMYDAAEFLPYVCKFDALFSRRMGLGLRRTTTIASGGSHCDFHFRKNGKTEVQY